MINTHATISLASSENEKICNGKNAIYLQKKNHKYIDILRYIFTKSVDGAIHFTCSHKYNTNSAEFPSNMNLVGLLFRE